MAHRKVRLCDFLERQMTIGKTIDSKQRLVTLLHISKRKM